MTGLSLLDDADRAALRRAIPSVEIRDIVREVADEASVRFDEVMGRSRVHGLVVCRHMAMFIAYRRGHSLSRIGRVLGMDHTSILHGVRAEALRRGVSRREIREAHVIAAKARRAAGVA